MEKIKSNKMVMVIFRFNEKERILITENGMIHSNSTALDNECRNIISMKDDNMSFNELLNLTSLYLNIKPIFLDFEQEDYRSFNYMVNNLN